MEGRNGEMSVGRRESGSGGSRLGKLLRCLAFWSGSFDDFVLGAFSLECSRCIVVPNGSEDGERNMKVKK